METTIRTEKQKSTPGGASKSALHSRFYKWHRVLGLIALVPVMMWTLSGITHPLMSNWFRPYIPNETFKPEGQDKIRPTLTVQQVLNTNHVTAIRNFSLTHFNDSTYYQVLLPDSTYQYYSAGNASVLPDGDRRYAIYLARYFADDQTSRLKQVSVQRTFDDNYQPINRLLPVWKVSFLRPDGMDIYVETGLSRMGTFNNTTRKSFLSIFKQLHTWGFLSVFGEEFRITVLLIVVSCMLFTLISGLVVYGVLWNKFKVISQKRKAANKPDRRFVHRFHRQLGVVVSFVMLTFVISAAFHLLVKLHNLSPQQRQYSELISTAALSQSNLTLPVADSLIRRIGLASFNNHSYYQVLTGKKMLRYFDTQTGAELHFGDQQYAAALAGFYRGNSRQSIKPVGISPIKQFTTEYGFVNKRLPVEKVSYPGQEDWYIETQSAKLATKVAGVDRAEGFSFIFLHKYFGITWAGKNIRDVVSMLAAMGILVASLFGFASFLKNKSI